MQINKKTRRPSTTKANVQRTAQKKGVEKKPVDKKPATDGARQRELDRVEKGLRDELEGTGAPHRVRDIVARLLGDDRSPAVEKLIGRLQQAATDTTAGPYGG